MLAALNRPEERVERAAADSTTVGLRAAAVWAEDSMKAVARVAGRSMLGNPARQGSAVRS